MNVQRDHVLHSANGRFGDDTTSSVEDVARILGSAASASRHLVLHFHGGLVSQRAGRGIADRLAPRYADAGAYPLFFVWESGLVESLVNNPRDILADRAFRALVTKVAEWVVKKIGGSVGLKGAAGTTIDEVRLREEFGQWFDGARARPPVVDLDRAASATGKGASLPGLDDLAADIEYGLDADPDFQDAFLALQAADPATTATALDDHALQALLPGRTHAAKGALSWWTVARWVATVVIAVIERYRAGRDHGIYCTVVEEVLRSAFLDKVGTVVWNQMKRDTHDGFGDDPRCCGTAVVRELGALQAAGRGFDRITLIGHSTGAIYICELLDAAARLAPELRFDVVLLAPAVSHARFADALDAHAGGDHPRVRRLRMFAMSEPVESADAMVPVLYTRSLLYFVSGLLEGDVRDGRWVGEVDRPLVGMQRYQDLAETYSGAGFEAVDRVRGELAASGRVVWSCADDGDGRRCASRKHGDFDNDETTLASLEWMLANAW